MRVALRHAYATFTVPSVLVPGNDRRPLMNRLSAFSFAVDWELIRGSSRQLILRPLDGLNILASRLAVNHFLGWAGGCWCMPDVFGAAVNYGHFFAALSLSHHNAAAPETISMISRVIAAWRTRFMFSVSEDIRSPALFVAASMAVMRAPCSEAIDSSSAR